MRRCCETRRGRFEVTIRLEAVPNDQLAKLCRSVGVDTSVERIASLGGAGGFSGARFWRCQAAGMDWCIRRWPLGTSRERVDWIHSVIAGVASRAVSEDGQCEWLAVAQRDESGRSSLMFDGAIFEVAPWLPGVANYWTEPSDEKLVNAMQALATWHAVAADVGEGQVAVSPGVSMRVSRCESLLEGQLERLAAAGAADQREYVRYASERLVAGFRKVAGPLLPRLRLAADREWRQQLCLRDIWHDHVLFVGDTVTGMVDYDAMRIESAVGDVARLLGSLVGNDRESHRRGLAAYSAVRPLADDEQELLSIWDASNAAMGGLQWIEWMCVDRREFDDQAAVARRLEQHVERIAGLC